jgi:hypothetical protein
MLCSCHRVMISVCMVHASDIDDDATDRSPDGTGCSLVRSCVPSMILDTLFLVSSPPSPSSLPCLII